MPRHMSWQIFLLLTVLSVGAVVRFHGLGTRGLVLYDGAYYANAAKQPAYLLDWWREKRDAGQRHSESASQFLKERGGAGYPVKPLHVLLLAAAFLIAGVRDGVVLGFSAACSWLTLFMLWRLGRAMGDSKTGLAAAACLAVSGNSVAFARTGYPQADTLLVLTGAMGLYLRSLRQTRTASPSFLAAAGAFAFASLMHPTAFAAAAGCMLAEVCRREQPWRMRVIRAATLMAAATVPFLLGYAVSGFMRGRPILSRALRLSDPAKGLVDLQLARSHGWWGVCGENAHFLADMAGRLETAWFLVPAAAGLILLGIRAWHARKSADILLLPQILVPVVYGILVYSTLKAVQVALPALALAAGLAVSEAMERLRRINAWLARGLFAVWLGGTLISGALLVQPWVRYRTGYPKMVDRLLDYMAREGGTLCIRDQGNLHEHLAFYLGEAIRHLPPDFRGHIDFTGTGGDYLIADYQAYLKVDTAQLLSSIESHAMVASIPNTPYLLPVYHVHRAVPSLQHPDYRALLDGPTPAPWSAITIVDLRKPRTATP